MLKKICSNKISQVLGRDTKNCDQTPSCRRFLQLVRRMWPQPVFPLIWSQQYLATAEEKPHRSVKWSLSQRLHTNNSDPPSVVFLHKYTDKQMISLPTELGVWAVTRGRHKWAHLRWWSLPVINEFVIPPWLAINDLTRRAAVIN